MEDMGRLWIRHSIEQCMGIVACFALAACSANLQGSGGVGANSEPAPSLDPDAPPVVTGLSSVSTPAKTASWGWGCGSSSCEYRFVVNTSSNHTFSSEPYGATAVANQNSGTGVYYIHVQAKDLDTDLESEVMTVSALLDNTVPTDPTSVSAAADASESVSATLSWSASTDETLFGYYEVAVGSSSGASDVVGWTNVGSGLSYQFTGQSFTPGATYYSVIRAVDAAGNVSGEVASGSWLIPAAPSAVSNLSVIEASPSTVKLGWTAPAANGTAITDYTLEYRLSGGSWMSFSDGVSADTVATVTGLAPSTDYEFRVKAYNGASSPVSNVALGSTTVNDPFFDPATYQAFNLGGATASAVVAMNDSTTVQLNGGALTTLNAGDTYGFTSSLNDIISADGPIFVAGRKGSGADTAKGNMVWSPPAWAGKEFLFTGTRNAPHIVTIYAFEDADVTVYQGGTTVASQSLLSGNNHTFSINAYGGFRMASTGLIIAYMYSSGGSSVVDPKPLLPADTDIIGFPSASLKLTSVSDSNAYTLHHSNGVNSTSSVNAGAAVSINPQGTSSLYQSESLRVVGADKLVGNSNADSNGNCSAPFMPVSMMKKRFAINVGAEWVAFASLEPGTINMIQPGTGTVTTLTLTRTGSDPDAPYRARTTSKAAGYRFESTVRFGAWYEPNTDTNAADNDETILFGAD